MAAEGASYRVTRMHNFKELQSQALNPITWPPHGAVLSFRNKGASKGKAREAK